jgi:hypothetical protein
MVWIGRRTVLIGEGPRMDCPDCGGRELFDVQLTYWSIRLGALGCACRFLWLFQCRACRETWIANRSITRELEQEGIPIPFLHRVGLLALLALLALLLSLHRC